MENRNFSAVAEKLKDKSLKYKETFSITAENLGSQSLGFIEGFLARGTIDKAFDEMLKALALYEIKNKELYKEAGFSNFAEFCESRGISKSEGYEWVKHVESVGPESFSILAEKVGLNRSFFRAFSLIPHEIQQAVIKGDVIEIDGKTYDFSGNGDSVKNLVMSLVRHAEKIKREAQEQLSALQTEVANSARRIKELEMQIPRPDDDSWASEQLSNIERSLMEFMNYMNYFCFSPEMVGKGKLAGSIRAKIEGFYQTAYRAFLEFIAKYEEYTGYKVRK